MDTGLTDWWTGTIVARWPDEYKSFRYVKQPVTQQEVLDWRRMGYYHDSFTGELYDSKNKMPEWTEDIKQQIIQENPVFRDFALTFYRMNTLDIMPPHVDHFRTYCKIFNVDRSKVYRCLVMLEDWKPGHYLEIHKVGMVNWFAGKYFFWACDVEHAAANIGTEPRYSLQITCHV